MLARLLPEFLDYSGNTIVEFMRYIESRKLVNIKSTFCLAEVHLIIELAFHDLLILVRFKPFDTLSFFPETALCWGSWNIVRTESVLFAAAPVAGVGTSI